MEKDTVSADGNPNNGLPATVIPDPRPGADDLPAEPAGRTSNGHAQANGGAANGRSPDAADEELTVGTAGERAETDDGASGESRTAGTDGNAVGEPAALNGGLPDDSRESRAAGTGTADGGASDAADVSAGSDGGSDGGADGGADERGNASAAGGDMAEADDAQAATGTAESGRRSWAARLRDPLLLALVFAVVGAALLVRAAQVRGDEAAENRALTDVERTEVVIGDVSNALGKVFSYSYADTAVTEQAARDALAGRAFNQYQTLFGQVRQRAAAQRLTLTSRVVRAGVVRMTGDTAQLLVFLDQTVHRKDKPGGTTAAAQLSVTARLSDGHWRIVDIQAR